MASHTAPAAVPGPNDPPQPTPTTAPGAAPTGGQQGPLASLLAPVAPARPAPPQNGPAGMSSAAFHAAGDTAQHTTGSPAGKAQQGVVRAWLLAGAERWRKGGDARLKRLEVKKAQAMSQQVKETRTVSVNRSPGIPPKGPSPSGGGGKPLGGPVKNLRNSNGNAHSGPSGRSGGGSGGGAGRGPSGGGGSAGGSGKGPAGASKPHSGGSGSSGHGKTPGGNGKPSGGSSPTSAPSGKPNTGSAGGSSGGKPPKPSRSGAGGSSDTSGGGQAGSTGKTGPGKGTGTQGPTPGTSNGKTPKTNKASKDTGPAGTGTQGPGTTPAGPSGKPAPAPAAADSKTGKTGKKTTGEKNSPHTGKSAAPTGPALNTQSSRETGYRDGTRAATVAAHVKAYSAGVKDGWTDTGEVAAREQHRLDQAHAARKQDRDKEHAVTAPASSADYHQPPQPVTVTGVTHTDVHLGPGAGRASMTRGEVRSLKSFERRLEEKATALVKVAESTKTLKAHAEQQATRATQLLEQAKAVKGGDKVTAALARLADTATVQAGTADEIHKRAVRAADAARVVLTNVQTRYGGIYQAVVDSPLTAPAELAFYKG